MSSSIQDSVPIQLVDTLANKDLPDARKISALENILPLLEALPNKALAAFARYRFGADHRTLLHEAAELGVAKIVQCLLPVTSDINPLTTAQQTPLELAVLNKRRCDLIPGRFVTDKPSDAQNRSLIFLRLKSRGGEFGDHFDAREADRAIRPWLNTVLRVETRRFHIEQVNVFESFARNEHAIETPGVFGNDTDFDLQVVRQPRRIIARHLKRLECDEKQREEFLMAVYGESEEENEEFHGGVSDFWENAGNILEDKEGLLRDWLERELAAFHMRSVCESISESLTMSSDKNTSWWTDVTISDTTDEIEWDEALIKLYTKETPMYSVLNQHLNAQVGCSRLYSAGKALQYAVFRYARRYPSRVVHDGVLYRGFTISDIDFECYERRSRSHAAIIWRSFTSTSLDAGVACRFGNAIFEIHVKPPRDPEHQIGAYLYQVVDITEVSIHAEQEVLIQAGTPFAIQSARRCGPDEYAPHIEYKVELAMKWPHVTADIAVDGGVMRGRDSVASVTTENGRTVMHRVMLSGSTFHIGGNSLETKEDSEDKPSGITIQPSVLLNAVTDVNKKDVLKVIAALNTDEDAELVVTQDLSRLTHVPKTMAFNPAFLMGPNELDVPLLKIIESEVDGEMLFCFEFEKVVDLHSVSVVLPVTIEEGDEQDVCAFPRTKLADCCPRLIKVFPKHIGDFDEARELSTGKVGTVEVTDEDVPLEKEYWVPQEDGSVLGMKEFFRKEIDLRRGSAFKEVKQVSVFVCLDADGPADEECGIYKMEFWGTVNNESRIQACEITDMCKRP